MENRIINDDILNDIFLVNTDVHRNSYARVSNPIFSDFYIIKDLVVYKELDNSKFVITNINHLDHLNKRNFVLPFVEVNPKEGEIVFKSKLSLDEPEKVRFTATFDHIEPGWDVRSFINGENKLSSVTEALDELGKNESVIDDEKKMLEKESFIELLQAIPEFSKGYKIGSK